MSEGTGLQRFERAVEALRHIPDPSLRLDAIRRARERLEALEATAVRDARHAGVTWKAIGALYGLSKQGAQQKFRGTPSAGLHGSGRISDAPHRSARGTACCGNEPDP